MPRSRGFTLIELSIVLVIIGLIVGGVLVGRDLILAAQVRKTGTLVEQIQTATMTFKGKYNCLPGDCPNAANFFPNATFPSNVFVSCPSGGFLPVSGVCAGVGDGDEDIYGLDQDGYQNGGPENGYFFLELIEAGLLADSRYCTLNGDSCIASHEMDGMGITIPAPNKGHIAPAVIGIVSLKHAAWDVGTPVPIANHALYFGTWTYYPDAVLSPTVLFMLDSKFDDGLPLSGRLQAVGFYDWAAPGIWNGSRANDGTSFFQAETNCNNTGVAPSVYYSNPLPGCAAMWMMNF